MINFERIFDSLSTSESMFNITQQIKSINSFKHVHRLSRKVYPPDNETAISVDDFLTFFASDISKSISEVHETNEKSGHWDFLYLYLHDSSQMKISFDVSKHGYIKTLEINGFVSESVKNQLNNFLKSLNFENYNPEASQHIEYFFLTGNRNLDSRSFKIENEDKFYSECYPWIDDPLKLMEDFKNSRSKILILLGEPGTGKTTFIKKMLLQNKWSSICAYDADVMENDNFYINFLSEAADVMILEDADLLLEGRLSNGNKTMSKLLNVSDGLISSTNKKFIFTANIKSKSDIDEALIRPGRCFDVIEFRSLYANEIDELAKATGIDYAHDKNISISEFFNKKEKDKQKSKMGFR